MRPAERQLRDRQALCPNVAACEEQPEKLGQVQVRVGPEERPEQVQEQVRVLVEEEAVEPQERLGPQERREWREPGFPRS